MAMSSIRSALARALIAPNLRAPRRFAATAAARETQPERVAAEMVRYALGGAAHRSSPEEAMRILEQGASNLQGGGEGSAEAVGLLMLAMSTLLYRSGKRQDAMEKLKATQQVAPSASFRVAAWEALMGLQMEAGQEISYSVSPNDSVDLSIKDDSKWSDQDHLKFRVNAIKGLIALLNGETKSGANHPKVGIVLTCVARMYKMKAKSESSSSIMVQEGLYRKALEVLKAPAINSEGTSKQMDWREIISLARGLSPSHESIRLGFAES
ncbi:hypothetical protein BAE44_0014662 [Dichanthelium oligosanthes]|uniref:Uncharacterized protein n=1 Tax=Dichanthelium oligosanthes TaxID=888268 RepID=A0A1E5VGR5_9POAL|nr:hypothetical protein BAE44_0014662 [Dichanthelium oligosanthes]